MIKKKSFSEHLCKDDNKKMIIIKPQWILYFGIVISLIILFFSYIYGTWPNIH